MRLTWVFVFFCLTACAGSDGVAGSNGDSDSKVADGQTSQEVAASDVPEQPDELPLDGTTSDLDEPTGCRVCSVDTDCADGESCDLAPTGAIGRCLASCSVSSACSEDATCEAGRCVPVDGCPCNAGLVGLVEACGPVGACADVRTCLPAGWSECKASGGVPETCNAQDDDCDGETDEGFEVGAPCDSDDEDGCAEGVWQCDEAGSRLCTDDAASLLESCNGKDDDCDGETDESLPATVCDGDDDDLCPDGQFVCGVGGAQSCADDSASVVERCNLADDDCDGEVDDGFDVGGPCDGDDDDDCTDGTWLCDAAGEAVCADDAAAGVETCNGKDDDCDGDTDEEIAVVACDGPDSDVCDEGLSTCADGEPGCDEPAEDDVELCNGVDDNCDGQPDEGLALGEACDGDDPDLCATGTRQCSSDAVECVESGESRVETCNAQDDDCDGLTDEGMGVGETCDGPDSDSCNDGVMVCDALGVGTECSDSVDGTVEVCNGVDDDCNGTTDDPFPTVGTRCDGDDDDACEDGVWACGEAGDVVCTDGPGLGVELCNGIDDDCDGGIDEDFAMLGAPCDGQDVDACEGGKLVCDGIEPVCDDDALAASELCNGADDDCDGQVDEGFELVGQPCDGPDLDSCVEGTWACANDVLACDEPLISAVELCNGADDDCDGQTDETFLEQGTGCDGVDADSCVDGLRACQNGQLVCVDPESAASPETCNGADDDCNGIIDDGFSTGQPCDGDDADACGDGKVVCAPGGAGVTCGDLPDTLFEVCNGLDDDCDGQTDEGFAVGSACDGPDGDLCAEGLIECDPGNPAKARCTDVGSTTTETCNGSDDDCNGIVDDPYRFALKLPCDGGDMDLCALGTIECSADGQSTACVEAGPGQLERCNGVDDDCDGSTDEQVVDAGGSCDGPGGDLCRGGTVVCKDGALTCQEVSNELETCNGLDDDCDGQTDEGLPGIGKPCDGFDTDLCMEGTLVCNGADGIACTDPDLPSYESCNGLDDDCDGTTDNNLFVVGLGEACDGTDADSCTTGVTTCSGGSLVCTDDGASTAETCNGADDDCDGQTDEGLSGTPCDSPDDPDTCKDDRAQCAGGQATCPDSYGESKEICNGIEDSCNLQSEYQACGCKSLTGPQGVAFHYCAGAVPYAVVPQICAGVVAGGRPMFLNSLLERIHFVNTISSSFPAPTAEFWAWMGIDDRTLEGSFVWTGSGKAPSSDSTSWAPGEPNDYGGSEDCVEVAIKSPFDGSTGRWNDITCFVPHPFICRTYDVCAEKPCGTAGGGCTLALGGKGYTCQCSTGYEFDGTTCVQINACAQKPCHPAATCTQTGPGTFTCKCNQGYLGNGLTCAPINACDSGPCSPLATCTTTGPGTFACDCKPGYSGNGQVCEEIDPCAAAPCSVNATCTKTGPGVATCACKPGFEGDGSTCTEVNACLTYPCSADAVCSKTGPGKFSCQCKVGYTGDGLNCFPKG